MTDKFNVCVHIVQCWSVIKKKRKDDSHFFFFIKKICILYRRPKRLASVSTAFRADQSAFDRQQAFPCMPTSSSDHLTTLGAGWEHGTRIAAAGARSIQLRSLSWARGLPHCLP